jgi:hypothetical protein
VTVPGARGRVIRAAIDDVRHSVSTPLATAVQQALDAMDSEIEDSAQLLVGDRVEGGGSDDDDAPAVVHSGETFEHESDSPDSDPDEDEGDEHEELDETPQYYLRRVVVWSPTVKGQVRDAERNLRSYLRVAIIRAVSKARTDAARWCAGRRCRNPNPRPYTSQPKSHGCTHLLSALTLFS